MRAAFYTRQGLATDVLEVGEQQTPAPGPGEVLVKLAFSGINPSDIKHRSGQVGAMAYPWIIPHQDGAGVIEAVGEGVPASRIGQRVWLFEAQTGRPCGTAAQYVALPEAKAVPLPDDVTLKTGASLGVPALTAHRCLFEGHTLIGKRVLVQGGAGAVGRAAVQLARWAGAWVCAGVRRAEQRDAVLAAGAYMVADPRAPDFAAAVIDATQGQGVDLIVDVDVTANRDTDLACLARGGTISAYATPLDKTPRPAPSIVPLMMANAAIRYVYVYTVPDLAKAAAVHDISAALSAGALDAHVGAIFPLDQIAQAHEAVESGGVGRVVLSIA